MSTQGRKISRGFSLIELVIVVMILAILASLIVTMAGGLGQISAPGGSKSDKQIITETSMHAIQDAIVGTNTTRGAWMDLGEQPALFPTNLNELVLDLHPIYGSVDDFNPVTKIGWRGPYLSGSVRQSDGTAVFLDGWGNPLTIFVPDLNSDSLISRDEIHYARLVSNGEDGKLDTAENETTDFIPGGTTPATALTLAECGDDLLLFLYVTDTRQ